MSPSDTATQAQPASTAKPPILRFAPSPTGYLHIGGARTALFNWLYAKANGGKMLLRIEDTDRKRHNAEAVTAILDGLVWMGLDWDGEPVSQFANAETHRAAALAMLETGNAYKCYLTPEDLAAIRAEAEAAGKRMIVQSPWRDRDPADAPADAPFVVRLKSPADGETHVADQVQGDVAFPNADLDDLILLRSDGSPTYNLAVVVDDHAMGVTHVIRGVDHLTNAGRQTQIYQALGWELPVYAHVPLIHGPDGSKLSKRHGALGIESYRDDGFLPAALRNYLVRLGWSHGDDEIIATEQLIEWFGFEGMGKSAARFDVIKLTDLNGHYIRHTDDAELVARVRAILPAVDGGLQIEAKLAGGVADQLLHAMPGLKERAKTLVELVHSAAYLVADRPLVLDAKADKILDDETRAHLGPLVAQLQALEAWTAVSTETAVRAFADAAGLKLGKIAQPLRAALTGTTVSPPVFDVMAVLGQAEACARIADQARPVDT